MNLHEICGGEGHEVYRQLELSNGNRQYDFLFSVVTASLATGTPFLSSSILKALNHHAITCLHSSAGEFRPCDVKVVKHEVGAPPVVVHAPPEPYRVQGLMDDFVNRVNRNWEMADALTLAAFVLWRLNWIHPFINGNGRTARAAAYFVLCVKAGGWLAGKQILPELIKANRAGYEYGLKVADDTSDLGPLRDYLQQLLDQQLASSEQEPPPANGVGPGDVPSGEPLVVDDVDKSS